MRRFGSSLPTIATVVPVYNGAAYLADAIHSVFSQSLVPDEVIVVDDGSTDNSGDILSDLARTYDFRIINQSNSGQSAARNLGVEHAKSDLIAFLDQDDIWYPDHLEELVVPFLESGQYNLGWVYSDLDEIDESGQMVCHGILRCNPHLIHPKANLATYLRQDLFMLPSASLIRRSAFRKVGGFNERLSGYEDDDLFLRLFRAGFGSEYITKPLTRWRIYSKSSSYSNRMAVSRYLFATMLVSNYPDVPSRSIYYIQDLIGPRFFRIMAYDFRRCVIIGNRDQQKVILEHLNFIVRYLRVGRRLPLQLFVLPMLRIGWIAAVTMRSRVLNRLAARWMN